LVPDKFATAVFANIALLIAPLAIEVTLPVLVTTPVKFALVLTVAAFPPIFKPLAVPVILGPTKVDGVPKAGLTSVGEVLMTTFPVPVIAFDTIFLLASVNTACEAVAVDKVGAAENVLAPAIVWAVVLTIPGLFASAGAKLKTPFVMVAPFGVALAPKGPTVVEIKTADVEPSVTHAEPL
jgi:hypothetical protein